MQIIGVVDARGGLAVHARGGRRDAYAPVTAVASRAVRPGSVADVCHVYAVDLVLDGIYLADLDAIAGTAPQPAVLAEVTGAGAPTWVDGGVTTVKAARRLLELGASSVIVGLETLTSFDALRAIVDACGSLHVAFGLDVRDGVPLHPAATEALSIPDLAVRARDAGVSSVIALDLGRVGAREGPNLVLIEQVRAAIPDLTLIAGGGIRHVQDLAALADLGCEGALVGSALLEGGIDRSGRLAARRLRAPSSGARHVRTIR